MTVRFYCPAAYPLFVQTQPGQESFGGSEVRCWRLASQLAQAQPDLQVEVAVDPRHFLSLAPMAGVRLLPGPATLPVDICLARLRRYLSFRSSFPWIGAHNLDLNLPVEIFNYAWTCLQSRLRPAPEFQAGQADFLCSFGNTPLSARVVERARALGRKSLVLLASDSDLDPFFASRCHRLHPWWQKFRKGRTVLLESDLLLVQTAQQQQLLKQRFGRDSQILPNPYPGRIQATSKGNFVLWVGKSDRNKRPELFLQLARQCPQLSFVMLMNRKDPAIFQAIHCQKPSNVKIVEHLPFDACERLFEEASVLVNTSRFEGFPNTFLQSACHGVPIASLGVNPDQILTRYGLGLVADHSMPRLTLAVQQLSTREHRELYAPRLQAYAREFHTPSQVAQTFIQALR